MSRRILSGVLDSVSRGYSIANSLKLDANHQNVLEYTPNVTGNRKTFTLSMWFKMANPDRRHMLYTFGSGGIQYWRGGIEIFEGGYYIGTGDTQLLKDSSAWYHVVAYVDTTQATASNRAKVYINGVEQDITYLNYWTQNYDLSANLASTLHQIGGYASDPLNLTDYGLDGNIAEFNWVDGQALPASNFGRFNTSGQWVPIKYSGSYGTNGVYLPFSNNSNAENLFRNSEEFDNSFWTKGSSFISANATTAPDGSTTADKFTEDTSANQHLLQQNLPFNASLGETYTLSVFAKASERTQFSITMHGEGYPVFNLSNGTVTGAGGTNISNTIVDYGNGWYRCSSTFNRSNTTGSYYIILWNNTNNYTGTSGSGIFVWGAQLERVASPSPYIKTISNRKSSPQFGKDFSATLSTKNYVCNNIPNTNGTGRWDSSYGPHRYWRYVESSSLFSHHPRVSRIVLTTTTGDTTIVTYTGDNCGDAGSISPGTVSYDFGSAVTVIDAKGYSTYNGENRIVKANIQWSDDNTNWTYAFTGIAHNAGGDCGLIPILGRYTNAYSYDTPTPHDALGVSRGNFAIVNSLSSYGTIANTSYRGPVYNAGLTISGANDMLATIGVTSGKWYWEIRQDKLNNNSAGNVSHYGISAGGFNYSQSGVLNSSDFIMIRNDTTSSPVSGKQGISSIGANTATYSAVSVGDTVGLELDLDSATKTLKIYKNNSLIYSVTFSYDGLLPIHPFFRNNQACIYTVNFGQTPFTYSAPSGSQFKSLNSNNLPVPNIINPKQYFDVAQYAGNGVNSPNANVVSGYNLQPNMVITKAINSAQNWHLQDSVNGLANFLVPNLTNGNSVTGGGDISSLNADGFTVSYANARTNSSGVTYSSSMWKESETSGFDIVQYTGSGSSAQAVSHNLGVAPKFIIIKPTSFVDSWFIWHHKLPAGQSLRFTNTGSSAEFGSAFGGTTPTSTNFYVGGSGTNFTSANGQSYMAYLFAPKPGFSQFGSYIGNGSTNGPFIDLGFRPALVIIKNTATEQWALIDYKRPLKGNSNASRNLYINSAAAEDVNVDYHEVDKVANGFKVRGTEQGLVNASGSNYIYAAFAEVPFKYSLAR